jgi:hypothetical protein
MGGWSVGLGAWIVGGFVLLFLFGLLCLVVLVGCHAQKL